jgi:hypothetical protein
MQWLNAIKCRQNALTSLRPGPQTLPELASDNHAPALPCQIWVKIALLQISDIEVTGYRIFTI